MVAEVEITTDVRSTERPPLEARIIAMVQGDYTGEKLRIDQQLVSSCDGVPYPGDRGFVIGASSRELRRHLSSTQFVHHRPMSSVAYARATRSANEVAAVGFGMSAMGRFRS